MRSTSGSDRMRRSSAESDRDEAGWIAIPELLDASEVDRILVDCDALLSLPAAQRSARDKGHGGTVHLDRLDERIPLVAEITRHPALIETVQRARRGTGSLQLDSAAFRSPRPGHGGQAFHIDSTPEGARAYVTVVVALCDFDRSNGATRVVPGSHRRPDLWRLARSHDAHPDEVLLVGTAGTAFVLSGGLLHSGTPNHSRSPRPALQLIWRLYG